jgi:adenylate cyclase
MSYREKSDRQALMQLFERHVSSSIAGEIWEHRTEIFQSGRLVPQDLEATILFTDLQNFSILCERLKPEMVLDFVNKYMECMSRALENHGAVINKYIGDSIMAIFGVPLPRTSRQQIADDAFQAVLAALDMRREMAIFNAEWKRFEPEPIRMRIGIFTGPLIAGSVGSIRRMEYTVLGHTVNAASRLESFDKKVMDPDIAANDCRILIGARTMELLGGRVNVRPLGSVELKGINESQIVYGVIGASETDDSERNGGK